ARAAAVVWPDVGVLIGDRELLGLHAELLGGEDRQPHHRAGAVLLGAGDDPSAAVGLRADERPRRPRRAEPPAGRDADRLVRAEGITRASPLDRELERLDRAVALVLLSGRTLVAVADEVPPAELDRVEPDPGRDDVVMLFDGPAALGSRRRADRARRRPVRVDRERLALAVRDPIGPGHHTRR